MMRNAVLLGLACLAGAAAQTVTLTGAIELSTTSAGTAFGGLLWNTLAGDTFYDLWLTNNPAAPTPINGPGDAQAGINLPLEIGRSYLFYMCGQPGPGTITGFDGLNLFFEGNNTLPGISVFGPTGGLSFYATAKSTLTLAGASVAGAGQIFYRSGEMMVVLESYGWDAPGAPPGDACQSFSFAPGNGTDYFGWMLLHVFPAATLTSSAPAAPPGAAIRLNGSAFDPTETVDIYAGNPTSAPIGTTAADANGSFAITIREAQTPNGPEGLFAKGQSSGRLAATNLLVRPVLTIRPRTVAAGGAVSVGGLGFGLGEPVNVYWGDSTQVLLGTATTNGLGSFAGSGALQITVPLNATPGSNQVLAIGQSSGAMAIGQVTVE